jgi:hypothetical protein
MPFFDRICRSCGAQIIDSFEPPTPPAILCRDCGEPTERAWLTKPANILRDEIDMVQHAGTKRPIHFRSRIERNRWLKQNNYREAGDGTCKGSKSGACVDSQTLANAAALVSRDGRNSEWRDPNQAPIGITSDDGVIRYLRDRNRAENRGEFGFSDR